MLPAQIAAKEAPVTAIGDLVVRNAGGGVTDDVIRSLAVSQRKLGTTGVMLLHHTGCGMATSRP